MVHYVAFYGTLKASHVTPIDDIIEEHMTFVGTCTIPGLIYRMPRYPALKPGSGRIIGELYTFDDLCTLAVIDTYEAVDNEDPALPGFSRRLIDLTDPAVQAWVYFYDGPVGHAKQIISGEWS